MNRVIIHPTDFSDCSMIAFEYSLNLAKILDCELFLIHVIDYSQMKGHDQSGRLLMDRSEEIEAQTEQKLKALGENAIRESIRCRAQLYNGSLTSILPDLIEQERPMLIVMGTVGSGSISTKSLEVTPIPLYSLLAHPFWRFRWIRNLPSQRKLCWLPI
jgi:nucleotide-binding universal stress UspA family protein